MSLGHTILEKFCEQTGMSGDAVYSKIKRGDWPRGVVYEKAPDGKIYIIDEGFKKWLRGEVTPVSGSCRKRRLRSVSTTPEKSAGNGSNASPTLPTLSA